jgi:hypothetical protein
MALLPLFQQATNYFVNVAVNYSGTNTANINYIVNFAVNYFDPDPDPDYDYDYDYD